jgi:hypothetical protein
VHTQPECAAGAHLAGSPNWREKPPVEGAKGANAPCSLVGTTPAGVEDIGDIARPSMRA